MDIGHNSGLLSPDTIQAGLELDFADRVKRTEDLRAAVGRLPAKVEDDATAARIADLADQFRKHIAALKKAHESAKDPYLTGGRIVDQFFNPAVKELSALLKDEVLARNTAYFTAKDKAERERAEAEAKAARDAAERIAQAATTEREIDLAIAQEEIAEAAEAKAQAPTADLTRVHSAHGVTTSLRSFGWKHRNVDRAKLDLEKLRHYLPAEALDQAIRAYIRANGTPPAALAGCEFFEDKRAA